MMINTCLIDYLFVSSIHRLTDFFLAPQPHLKKCFGNVRKLGIKLDTGAFHVYHMISAEDECVALHK